jgi:hypothetical protein
VAAAFSTDRTERRNSRGEYKGIFLAADKTRSGLAGVADAGSGIVGDRRAQRAVALRPVLRTAPQCRQHAALPATFTDTRARVHVHTAHPQATQRAGPFER